jgi:hypothetical protein
MSFRRTGVLESSEKKDIRVDSDEHVQRDLISSNHLHRWADSRRAKQAVPVNSVFDEGH